MSKEQKLSVAGLLSVLFASVFIPFAVGQEPPGAWTGTWVGSFHGIWRDRISDPDGTADIFVEEYTNYLTITFKGWEYTGTQRIVCQTWSWIDTDSNVKNQHTSVTPMEFNVAIHGAISTDNRLYLIPDEKVIYHYCHTWLYRVSAPGEPEEKWVPLTEEDDADLAVPFIDVAVERMGNDIMWICERRSSSETHASGSTSYISYYADGVVALQKEGRVEIKPTCLDVEGEVVYMRPITTITSPECFLEPGMELKTGDRITAAAHGRAVIILPDGSQVTVGGSTSISLDALLETGIIKMKLYFGKIYLRVKSMIDSLKPRNKFEIETPLGDGAVRGTEFTVEVSEDGTTTLTVLEGTVTFSDLQETKTIEVSQNQTSTIRPGGVPSEPLAIDPGKLEAWWEEKPVEKTETTEITSTSITETIRPTTVTVVSTASLETITTFSAPTTPIPSTGITTTRETETSLATETTETKPPVTTTLGPTLPVSTSTMVILAAVIVAAVLAVVALRRLSKKKQDEAASLTSP